VIDGCSLMQRCPSLWRAWRWSCFCDIRRRANGYPTAVAQCDRRQAGRVRRPRFGGRVLPCKAEPISVQIWVPAALATKAPAADQDSPAIVRLMNEFLEAERRYDKAAVSNMLDKGFIYVGNDGSLTRRAEFTRLTDKALNPIEVLDFTNVEVHVIGITAVATGLIHEKGTIDGRGYEFNGRTLTIFPRQNGKWVCAAIHD
jgi:ketosteroid isomerase-like protein